MIRILFIGGKKHNVPADRLLCEWEQYEQDSSQLKRGEIAFSKDKPFHIILCFNDFIGHAGSEAIRNKARMLGIKFVGSSGGFSKLVEAARLAGEDLSPFIKSENGSKPQQDKPPIERIPPSPVIEWAKSIPKTAVSRVVNNNMRVWAMPNRVGGESVLLKGKVLDDAVSFVRQKKLGKGARGGLTPKEAALVRDHLESIYGFTGRGLSLQPTSITRNVGVVLDTLPTATKNKILGPFAKGKEVVRKAARKSEEILAGKQERAMSPEEREAREAAKMKVASEIAKETGGVTPDLTKYDSPVGSGNGSGTVERFSADIARALEQIFLKHDALYGKIVDLSKENGAFLETIVRLEGERDTLRSEVEALKEEIVRWKKRARDMAE